LFKKPFLTQISNCLILHAEKKPAGGILVTPVPFSDLISNPLDATVATLLYDVREIFPDGAVPLWHPVHED
jgi:hypothetical protein